MFDTTRFKPLILVIWTAILAGNAFGTAHAAAESGSAASQKSSGFASPVKLPVLRHAHSVVADDMNEDGRIDLVVATAAANSVAFLAGNGDGTFKAATYWQVGTTPKFAATGDFNRDGHRDIVTADQDSKTISILLGNGDGTFKEKKSYPSCNGDHEVAVADFNGDSNDDVVVACHGKPYFASVFLGKGDGTFQSREDLTAGAEPTAVVVGDFDHDGVPDLAFANRVADTVSILLGNGDGTFKPAAAYATAPSPHGIRTGDLNGDGFLDLVTADDESNTVTVLFGKGDGSFGGRVDLAANSLPKSAAVADVNGDGYLDIVVTNTTYPTCCTSEGSTISVFLNRGDGTFSPRQDYYAGGNPFSLLIRDLNGDGKVDIATANYMDQTEAQHLFLQTTHAFHLTSRMAKLSGLAVISLLSALVVVFSWNRARWVGIACGLILAAILASAFLKFAKLRTESDSHVSILNGD